jgi:zinc transporter, ZIP family
VLEAALWGLLSAGSLLVGAVLVLVARPSSRVVGLALAFGAGALISAVAYDLVLDAFDEGRVWPALGLALGALTFYAGDTAIDRMGGHGRKSMAGEHQSAGTAYAIVLGTVLDGIPESFVLGASLVAGGAVSLAFIAAVFLSNLPEAISGTSGLRAAGWSSRRLLAMWSAVVAFSVLASVAGYAVLDAMPGLDGSVALAFAAGSLLVMLADTMMPEAFELGGRAAGLVTALGFALAFALTQIE